MSTKKSLEINQKKIKNLNALNASLATNYKDLLCKFKLLSKEHEELKLKVESINDTNDFLEMNQVLKILDLTYMGGEPYILHQRFEVPSKARLLQGKSA